MPPIKSPEAEPELHHLINNEERRASYPYPGTGPVRTSLSIGDHGGIRRHFHADSHEHENQGRTRSSSSSFSSATAPTPYSPTRSSSLSTTTSSFSSSNEKYELRHLEYDDNSHNTNNNNHSRRSSLSVLEEKKHNNARKKIRRNKDSEYGRSKTRLSISGLRMLEGDRKVEWKEVFWKVWRWNLRHLWRNSVSIECNDRHASCRCVSNLCQIVAPLSTGPCSFRILPCRLLDMVSQPRQSSITMA